MKYHDLLDRVAAANPVRTEALGDSAGTPRAEALRREILAGTRAPSPRKLWRRQPLMIALPAIAVAATAAVLAVFLRTEPIPQQRLVTGGEAHTVMLAAAQRAADAPAGGRFWHAEGEIRLVFTRDHRGHRYTLVARHPTSTWTPSDRRDGIGVSTEDAATLRPLTAADAGAYQRDGSPQPNENPDPDLGVSVPQPPNGPELAGDSIYEGDPAALPTEPLAMRQAMLTWVRDRGGLPANPQAWLFREAAYLLSAEVKALPRQTRAAIYRMLAGLPGVRSLGRVKDALGRPALAVAMTETTARLGTLEWRLYLSPTQDLLMGTQAIVVQPGKNNQRIAPGQAQYTRIVRLAEWTAQCPPRLLPSATRACP